MILYFPVSSEKINGPRSKLRGIVELARLALFRSKIPGIDPLFRLRFDAMQTKKFAWHSSLVEITNERKQMFFENELIRWLVGLVGLVCLLYGVFVLLTVSLLALGVARLPRLERRCEKEADTLLKVLLEKHSNFITRALLLCLAGTASLLWAFGYFGW